jgi:hypothetical protein
VTIVHTQSAHTKCTHKVHAETFRVLNEKVFVALCNIHTGNDGANLDAKASGTVGSPATCKNVLVSCKCVQGWPEPFTYGVCTAVVAGKSPNIRARTCWRVANVYRVGQNHLLTVYVRQLWQENHQIYVQERAGELQMCKGWPEPFTNGVCTAIVAGKSPNVRSYTVHI